MRYTTVTYEGWEPIVESSVAYTFDIDGEFYMHSTGINYILFVFNSGNTIELKKEFEDVIQPGIEATSLDGVTFTSNGTEYKIKPRYGVRLLDLTTAAAQAQQ